MADQDAQPDPLDALLDHYEREADVATQKALAKQHRAATKGKQRSAAEQREEGLAKPLREGIGYKLLKSMGYRDGRGLGVGPREGMAAPIQLDLKAGRAGLGVDEAKKRRRQERAEEQQAEEARRQRTEVHAMAHFKGRSREEFQQRKLLKQLRSAWAACESLEEQQQREWADAHAGQLGRPGSPPPAPGAAAVDAAVGFDGAMTTGAVEGSEGQLPEAPAAPVEGPVLTGPLAQLRAQLPALWTEEEQQAALLAAGDGDPDAYEGSSRGHEAVARCGREGAPSAAAAPAVSSAAPDEGPACSSPSLQQQLQTVLAFLRGEPHFYCMFCGHKYGTEAELQQQCPGPGEDEH